MKLHGSKSKKREITVPTEDRSPLDRMVANLLPVEFRLINTMYPKFLAFSFCGLYPLTQKGAIAIFSEMLY
jgi:hypothetical protein